MRTPTSDDRSRLSSATRAAIALVLMVGFYLLAIAIIVALGSVFVIEARTDLVPGIVLIAAPVAIVCILVGIIPRGHAFHAPGPRVSPERQRPLFDEIRRVAEATGSAMPHDVYISMEVNAGVAHVGGWAGIGSRPVLFVGLPLIAALTVAELRCVIAHEFGHYVGGETKFAPLIYRTRESMGRTIDTLEATQFFLIQAITLPFHAYAVGYMRLTQAISRRQELDADALGAAIGGNDAAGSALIKTEAAAAGFVPYVETELGPAVATGFHPPIAEGFSRFLDATEIVGAIERAVREPALEGSFGRYDSHPSLDVRLAALRAEGRPLDRGVPALDLLDDIPSLEHNLLLGVVEPTPEHLEPIEWRDVADRVWLPGWRALCREAQSALEGVTPGSLADDGRRDAMRRPHVGGSPFTVVIGAALTVLLASRGWAIETWPGATVTATSGPTSVDTFTVLDRLDAGDLSGDAWRAVCLEAGVADVDLGTVGGLEEDGADPAPGTSRG